MMLWALPAAINNGDLTQLAKDNGLVQKVLQNSHEEDDEPRNEFLNETPAIASVHTGR